MISKLLSSLRKLRKPATADSIRFIAQRPIVEKYLKATRLSDNNVTLDIGCGYGFYTGDLERISQNTVGMDIQISVLKQNKKNMGSNINWVCGTMEYLPFKNSCFDLLLCTEVLEHVDNDSLAMSELSRVLKNGGKSILSLPSKDGGFWSFWEEDRSPFGHKREGYTLGDIKNLLATNDIHIVKRQFNMYLFSRMAVKILRDKKVPNFWIISISLLDILIPKKYSKPADIVVVALKNKAKVSYELQ